MAKNIKKTEPRNSPSQEIFTLEGMKEFIRFFEKVNVAEVEISIGDKTVVLNKTARTECVSAPVVQPVQQFAPQHIAAPVSQPQPSVAPSSAAVASANGASDLIEIKSPIVGTFYVAADPKLPPFAEVGTTITPGKTVCIIEAMKVFNEIKAEFGGVIREVCVKNEQPVEFGQVLFRVEAR